MTPLTVLLGIIMGSTVALAIALGLTGIVFLLLPEYSARLAGEDRCRPNSFLFSVAAREHGPVFSSVPHSILNRGYSHRRICTHRYYASCLLTGSLHLGQSTL